MTSYPEKVNYICTLSMRCRVVQILTLTFGSVPAGSTDLEPAAFVFEPLGPKLTVGRSWATTCL